MAVYDLRSLTRAASAAPAATSKRAYPDNSDSYAKEGSFALAYPLSRQCEPGYADMAGKKGPPPHAIRYKRPLPHWSIKLGVRW